MLRKLNFAIKDRYLSFTLCDRLISSTSGCKFVQQHKDNPTHFGFESVTEREKEEKVYAVFHNVADKYDLMNDAMSMGIHRLWKDTFVSRLRPQHGSKIIDVAGGTGDIAFRMLNFVQNNEQNNVNKFEISDPSLYAGMHSDISDSSDSDGDDIQTQQTHITVCDINHSMLRVGSDKAQKMGYGPESVSWVQGNAESLPMEDNTFDVYTIAYGIRNTTHVDKVLEEAYRVLRPGGRFMCLEFSEVPNIFLRKLYDQYSFQVIPVMGQIIAGDFKSYRYLVESIRKFPNQEKFSDMIRAVGFTEVHYENMTFGVTAIHSGFKL